MSKPNTHEALTKVAALLSQLQASISDPARLQAIVRQGNFGHVAELVCAELAQPPEASDHLSEEQVANAVEVCNGLVAAYIRAEGPGSIPWESLDACNELARKVVGREAVHDMYRRLRPENLQDYIQDEAAGFPAFR